MVDKDISPLRSAIPLLPRAFKVTSKILQKKIGNLSSCISFEMTKSFPNFYFILALAPLAQYNKKIFTSSYKYAIRVVTYVAPQRMLSVMIINIINTQLVKGMRTKSFGAIS